MLDYYIRAAILCQLFCICATTTILSILFVAITLLYRQLRLLICFQIMLIIKKYTHFSVLIYKIDLIVFFNQLQNYYFFVSLLFFFNKNLSFRLHCIGSVYTQKIKPDFESLSRCLREQQSCFFLIIGRIRNSMVDIKTVEFFGKRNQMS